MIPTRDEQHWMYRNMVTSRKFEETIVRIFFEAPAWVRVLICEPVDGENRFAQV